MAILATDLEFRLSNPLASGGDQLSQNNPGDSLGGYASTSVWVGGSLHDLFDAVTGDENVAGQVDYRQLFVLNKHASLTWTSPVFWVSQDTQVGGVDFAIGVDTAVASALNDTAQQAAITTSTTQAPAGVSFSKPLSKGAGLALGDLPPGYVKSIWLRRTAGNTAALEDEIVEISVEGDTL